MLRREYDTKRAANIFSLLLSLLILPNTGNGKEQLQQQQNSCIDHILWKQEHKEALTSVEQKAPLEMLSHERVCEGSFPGSHLFRLSAYVSLFPHIWLEPALPCPTHQNDS